MRIPPFFKGMRISRVIAAGVLFGLFLSIWGTGCKSVPKIDPSGESLCIWKQAGAKQLSSSDEKALEQNVSGTSSCGDSPWKEASVSPTENKWLGAEADEWSAQRPNGAVLFPQKLKADGPLVVLEPKSMIAQIGSEIVMVASFLGEDNERLRVGETLEWNIDGVGRFLTGNPRNGCLYCDFGNSKKIDDHTMKTVTSNRLWRIHRGTSSPNDDISILRGQSWTTIQSFQEGTTTVSILAPDIDNWHHRTAGGQIHWVDAAFYYPKSGIAPIGKEQLLSTSIYRKTTMTPRPGWIVRYEVLSGPSAGFGANFDQTVEIESSDDGEASVVFAEQSPVEGVSKIKIQIIRPSNGIMEKVVVDEQIISQTWTGNSPFSLSFTSGSGQVKPGARAQYGMTVTNLTNTPQDAIVRLSIPDGMNLAASNPTVSANQNQTAVWVLEGIPPQGNAAIAIDMDILSSGNHNLDARVEKKTANTPLIPSQSSPSPAMNDPGISSQGLDPFQYQSTPATPSISGSNSPAKILFTRDFPSSFKVNEIYSGILKVNRAGMIDSVVIQINLPSTTLYVDMASQTTHASRPDQPLNINVTDFNRDYPICFISNSVGIQEIEFKLLDSSGKVLETVRKTVNITP